MEVLFPEKPDELWDMWKKNPNAKLMAGGTDLLIDGKAFPHWIIETVRKWYNQAKSDSFNVHDFANVRKPEYR